jgi:RNA polymerase sigma factor (sigma-70 family)
MDDTLLVSRALAGDLDSFGQLYDRYFPRVYDFAWRLLRDADEASAVTQSVFATAMANLPALPKAASFRSWLFTIAHQQTVTRASGLGRDLGPSAVHEEAFGSFDVPDPCRVENPALVAGDPEMAQLVWEAAIALSPRDYGLLDLHVRQGLDSSEIASVLAMSRNNAYTLVTRMKAAAGGVMTSYILARRGNKDCDGLQRVLAPFDFPPYTDDVRRAVEAHTLGCETCRTARRRIPPPLDIFGAFAAVAVPQTLKGDIWRAIANSWHVRRADAAVLTAGAGDSPPPWTAGGAFAAAMTGGRGIDLGGGGLGGGGAAAASADGWDRQRVLWFAGAAGGMLLFAFVVGTVIVMAVGGGSNGGGNGAGAATRTPGPTRTPTAAVSITPGVAIESPTPDLTPPATRPPEPTSTESPATQTPVPASPTKPSGVKSATPTTTGGTPSPAAVTPAKATPTVKATATPH